MSYSSTTHADADAAPEDPDLRQVAVSADSATVLRSARRRPLGGALNPIGHAEMRSSNTGLVLRHLYTRGALSRARLAAGTGLSKASVSSIVAELTARGLVEEGAAPRCGGRGRPGTQVAVSNERVCGIGAEINVDYVVVSVMDLAGRARFSRTIPMPYPTDEDSVITALAAVIAEALGEASRLGLWPVGIMVAPPGVIDDEAGAVRFAPNLGWRDVPLVARLRHALRAVPGRAGSVDLDTVPLGVENDAKLAAMAAYFAIAGPAAGGSPDVRDPADPLGPVPDHPARDLVYLTGDEGVGAGIMSSGRILRGYSGFSGEVGHMRTHRSDLRCSCGRTGCWELYVGLRVLIAATPEGSAARDRTVPIDQRLAAVRDLLDDGDAQVCAALDQIIEELHGGLEILVDVLNPRVLVLGGYFSWFLDIIVPRVQARLDERILDEGGRVQVTGTPRGLDTAAIGGGLMALDRVLQDPSVVPLLERSPRS